MALQPARDNQNDPYRAPEFVPGATLDPRADIFSVGAMLYEMLTGRRAVRRPAAANGSDSAIDSADGAATGVPAGLSQIVDEALAEAADQRIGSAKEMTDRLVPFAQVSRPSLAPRDSAMPFLSPEARRSRGMARLERAVLGANEPKPKPGKANLVVVSNKGEGDARGPNLDLEYPGPRAQGAMMPDSNGRGLRPEELLEPRIPKPPRTPRQVAPPHSTDDGLIAPVRVRLPNSSRRRSNRVRYRAHKSEKAHARPPRPSAFNLVAGLLAAAGVAAGLLLAHFLHF